MSEGKRYRVHALFVDDQEENYLEDKQQFEVLLGNHGIDFTADHCHTVGAALGRLKKGQLDYQMVVADLLFPPRNRPDAPEHEHEPRFDAIRQAKQTDGVVVVALSIGGQARHPHLEEDARGAGADLFAYRNDLVGKSGLTWERLAAQVLDKLRDFGIIGDSDRRPELSAAAKQVVEICRRFPQVVRLLSTRERGRPALTMDDEYDVQYVLGAMLATRFDDVRMEEPTPSTGARASRIDFLLPEHNVAVEVKRLQRTSSPKRIQDELILDAQYYARHDNAKHLICFVYDPERSIRNPTAIERDLAKIVGGVSVIPVVVSSR